jgi:hypothetical protein
MTKFLSKVFFSGILLSSISGYCTSVDVLNIEPGNSETNGAISALTNDYTYNYDINVGNAESVDSEKYARLDLQEHTLTLGGNMTINASGKVVGTEKEGKVGTISLTGDKTVVFHPGSIADNPTIKGGIVDLTNYVVTNEGISFAGNRDALKLTLDGTTVKLFSDTQNDETDTMSHTIDLFNSALNNTLSDNGSKLFDNIKTTQNNNTPTVKLLGIPYLFSVTNSLDNNALFNKILNLSEENYNIVGIKTIKKLDSILNGSIKINDTEYSSILELLLGNVKYKTVKLNFNSLKDYNLKLSEVQGQLLDGDNNKGGYNNVSILVKDYQLEPDANKNVELDLNKVEVTGTITEPNDIESVLISNANINNTGGISYNAMANANRTFNDSKVTMNNSSDVKTGNLDLKNATLNITGDHQITGTISSLNGTLNIKAGSTIHFGQPKSETQAESQN